MAESTNNIPFAFKNTHFQRASFREGHRCRSLKEMTIPALLRLVLHENLPPQNRAFLNAKGIPFSILSSSFSTMGKVDSDQGNFPSFL